MKTFVHYTALELFTHDKERKENNVVKQAMISGSEAVEVG
jgi:hypothetical protein